MTAPRAIELQRHDIAGHVGGYRRTGKAALVLRAAGIPLVGAN